MICVAPARSPRKIAPRAIVTTGPIVPMRAAWLAPMRRSPSDISSAGSTVENTAMIAAMP